LYRLIETVLGYHSGKFIYLVLMLLSLLILFPFLQDATLGRVTLDVLLTIILLSSLFAVSQKPTLVLAGGIVAVTTILTIWLERITGNPVIGLVSLISGYVFFMYVTMVILWHLFQERRVTIDEIAAAVSTYLLLGLAGSFLYGIIEILHPGSLHFIEGQLPTLPEAASPHFSQFIYYSFTTLTTLGYGDIYPATPFARVASYLEAVFGQIYLTILVARLVGLHISQPPEYPE